MLCITVVMVLSGMGLATFTTSSESPHMHTGSTAASELAAAKSSLAVTPGAQAPSNTDRPSPRSNGGMVYDAQDGYVLLFGGTSWADTWIFDGDCWKNITPAVSPPARGEEALAYDPVDHYVVLFGGANASGELNDTWTFKAGIWTQLHPAHAPSPRSFRGSSNSLVYDEADGYMLLFGGTDWSSIFGDTWSFKGGQWTQLFPATSPSARANEGLAYDAADGYVVLFGGMSCFASYCGLSDTWKYVGGVWTQLNPTSIPTDRDNTNLIYDPVQGKVVMFGGWSPSGGCGVNLGDTWEFGAGQWTQLTENTSPSARQSYYFTWDPSTGSGVLFGGQAGDDNCNGTNMPQQDTWFFSGTLWSNVTANLTNCESYGVSFTESALPSGTNWSVTLNNQTRSSTNRSITFNESNGSYAYTVGAVSGYTRSPSSGSVTINGVNKTVIITFTPFTYAVTFSGGGLPSGTNWSVTLDRQTMYSTARSITFNESNGSYAYTVGAVSGYIPSPSSGSLTVNGAAKTVSIIFTRASAETTYVVTFIESGLHAGTSWSVTLNGSTKSSTTATITFQEPNGSYALTLGSVNGYTVGSFPETIKVNGAAVSQSITFTSSTAPGKTNQSAGFLGLPGYEGYLLIGVIVVVIAAVAGALLMRKRTPPKSSTDSPKDLDKGKLSDSDEGKEQPSPEPVKKE